MHASAYRVTIAAATATVLEVVAILTGGCFGSWAGYTYASDTASHNSRLAVAGAAALAVAGIGLSLTAPFTSRLRSLRETRDELADRDTLEKGLAQVAAATETDAAHRAAIAARYRIAQGESPLGDAARWRGDENGEAFFFLAPGVWLHFRSDENKWGNADPRFTLLTGDSDQEVPITNVAEIRHHLAARAAGLPVAPATAPDNVLDDDLTGLHT